LFQEVDLVNSPWFKAVSVYSTTMPTWTKSTGNAQTKLRRIPDCQELSPDLGQWVRVTRLVKTSQSKAHLSALLYHRLCRWLFIGNIFFRYPH